jgi:hypothetical protein
MTKELASLRDDPLRFAASIIFLGRKKAGPEAIGPATGASKNRMPSACDDGK